MNNESSTWTAGEIRKLEQRVAELTVANDEKAGQVRKLRDALEYVFKKSDDEYWPMPSSSDCSDHCSNKCGWCIARAALAATEPQQ
jgi:hypothetical protein